MIRFVFFPALLCSIFHFLLIAPSRLAPLGVVAQKQISRRLGAFSTGAPGPELVIGFLGTTCQCRVGGGGGGGGGSINNNLLFW
uniref:Putative secreted protein n=1 Tax=Anopheles darlingi TaxID=43151 RepID=A0A2M4DMC4_ANODA